MASEKNHRRKRLCAVLLLAGAALIAAGISGGEYRFVLIKAMNICFECVGLG